MKTVWKYEIPMTDTFTLRLPAGSTPLTVDIQRGKPHIWIEVDPGRGEIGMRFYVVGTGHDVPENSKYVGSYFLLGADLVFHVYVGD